MEGGPAAANARESPAQGAVPRVGLAATMQPATSGRKSRPISTFVPSRVGEVWQQVIVVNEHQVNPRVECIHCAHQFSGGVSRIKLHITEQCLSNTATFLGVKEKVKAIAEADKAKKRQKTTDAQLDVVSEMDSSHSASKTGKAKCFSQQDIQSSLSSGKAISVDNAIADFFYGCNIAPSVAGSPTFKHMVESLKAAPASYKPPNRDRLLPPGRPA